MKALAVVAIAVGVAFAAPYLAGFIAAQGTLAFTAAAAVIGAGLTAAASAIIRALSAPPTATRSFHPGSSRPVLDATSTAPRSPGRWRDPIFMPWWRFSIEPMTGDCMQPAVSDRWAIVDRQAEVRAGDFILIRVSDQRRYYWPGWRQLVARKGWRRLPWVLGGQPMGKRFIGIAADVLAFECLNPRTYMEVPLDEVQTLYRVRATAPNLAAAFQVLSRMRLNPCLFDNRLAATD
ncbi:hypothetical protein MOP88_04120 [Sphingomonas sp. WKB10]|nr:hypothetical protein [Sphingomonas sp. WKB10]